MNINDLCYENICEIICRELEHYVLFLSYIYISINEKNVELELEYFGMCLDVLIQIYFNVE